MTASFSLDVTIGRSPHGVPIAQAVVRPLRAAEPADRDALLTDGVFAVIEHLARTSQQAEGGCSVIDLRIPDDVAADSLAGTEAFVEAVRGLVQSLTLETPPQSPACNIVVSSEGQSASRDRTIHYLISPHGDFSRGSTYDLREAKP